MSDSLRPHGLQHTRLPYSLPSVSVFNFMSIVGYIIQPYHSKSPSSPPALSLSQHQVFSNESALCIRWSKYWSFSFSFSISPSNEHSELIYFRMNWFDLLAVQETLKSLFQHNLKASVLWFSAFFMGQLSHS